MSELSVSHTVALIDPAKARDTLRYCEVCLMFGDNELRP